MELMKNKGLKMRWMTKRCQASLEHLFCLKSLFRLLRLLVLKLAWLLLLLCFFEACVKVLLTVALVEKDVDDYCDELCPL